MQAIHCEVRNIGRDRVDEDDRDPLKGLITASATSIGQ
jgi:hypothetical protein